MELLTVLRSFLLPNSVALYGYATFSLFTSQWRDTWVISISCFFINNAAINMDMKTSIQYPYFNSLDIPDVEFPDHMVILILIF